jgi:hydrogenase/urease accessory protein HupE
VFGGLVATDAKLPLAITTVLATMLGLVHGSSNGAALAQPGPTLLGLVGVVGAAFSFVALAGSVLVPLQAAWARVIVRVAGSWVAATGLLLLDWAARPAAG